MFTAVIIGILVAATVLAITLRKQGHDQSIFTKL